MSDKPPRRDIAVVRVDMFMTGKPPDETAGITVANLGPVNLSREEVVKTLRAAADALERQEDRPASERENA